MGRDDDVIKASDYRIGPFEVESVMIEHDKVVEAAVVASPDRLKSNASAYDTPLASFRSSAGRHG